MAIHLDEVLSILADNTNKPDWQDCMKKRGKILHQNCVFYLKMWIFPLSYFLMAPEHLPIWEALVALTAVSSPDGNQNILVTGLIGVV